MKQGEQTNLSVDFLPGNTTDNKDVIYTSSNEEVLTVDEKGIVTAHKAGKAIITVTAENGVQSQIELTVEESQVQGEEITPNSSSTSSTKEQTLTSASPKTGDMNVGLYVVLMIISFIGIIKWQNICRKK